MYLKTARIIIPCEDWFAYGVKVDRFRLKTLLHQAAKANQLDEWNHGDTSEGDGIFEWRDNNERMLWLGIRAENRKLWQRSNAGKQPRNINKNLTLQNESV